MTDNSHIIAIETYQGIAIDLDLTTGTFHANVPRGLLTAERLVTMRSYIRQALLIERALTSRDAKEVRL